MIEAITLAEGLRTCSLTSGIPKDYLAYYVIGGSNPENSMNPCHCKYGERYIHELFQ